MAVNKTFHLEIITPERIVFDHEIVGLSVPAAEGSLGILPGHTPIVAKLTTGVVKVRSTIGDDPLELFVSGGFMEVENNHALIMADIAENADEIDEVRAQQAKERAEARLRARAAQIDFTRARAALQRATVRLRLAGHLRRSKPMR